MNIKTFRSGDFASVVHQLSFDNRYINYILRTNYEIVTTNNREVNWFLVNFPTRVIKRACIKLFVLRNLIILVIGES